MKLPVCDVFVNFLFHHIQPPGFGDITSSISFFPQAFNFLCISVAIYPATTHLLKGPRIPTAATSIPSPASESVLKPDSVDVDAGG